MFQSQRKVVVGDQNYYYGPDDAVRHVSSESRFWQTEISGMEKSFRPSDIILHPDSEHGYDVAILKDRPYKSYVLG